MHVAIVYEGKIPALKYGGIQRVLWYLGQELIARGHGVTYLVSLSLSLCYFYFPFNSTSFDVS